MVHPRDRERAARRRAEEARYAREGRELDRRIRDNELEIARNEAKIEALRDEALRNEGLRRAVRESLAARKGKATGRYELGEVVMDVATDHGVTDDDVDAAIREGLGFGAGDGAA